MPKTKGRHIGVYINGDVAVEGKLTKLQRDVFNDLDFDFKTNIENPSVRRVKKNYIFYDSLPVLKMIIREQGGNQDDIDNSINMLKEYKLKTRKNITSNNFEEQGFENLTELKRYFLLTYGYSPKKTEKIVNGKDNDLNHMFIVKKEVNRLPPYTIESSFNKSNKDSYYAYQNNKKIGIVSKVNVDKIKTIMTKFIKGNELNDLLGKIKVYSNRDILNSYHKNSDDIKFTMPNYFRSKSITYQTYTKLLNKFNEAKQILSAKDIKKYQVMLNLYAAIWQSDNPYKEGKPNLKIGKIRRQQYDRNSNYKYFIPNWKPYYQQAPKVKGAISLKKGTREFSDDDKEDFIDNAEEFLDEIQEEKEDYKKEKKSNNNKIINEMVNTIEKKIITIIKS